MNNTFYFLRHAETEVDKNLPVSEWTLSENGIKQAEELANTDIFADINIVISSDEGKAHQTAKPIAEKLEKEIIRIPELNEIDRDKGAFLEKEKFDETIKSCLTNLNKSINNWETASHALERFSRQIEKLDSKHENVKMLIVSHGCVINLYFAKILDKLDEAFERWLRNTLCDWGIIKNSEVIKDIVRMK